MTLDADLSNVGDGLERLNSLLPLASRQAALPAPLRALHQAVLHRFATSGVPLTRAEVAEFPGIDDVDAALQRLAGDDLLVLSPERREITGAYPFTVEQRVHRVALDGRSVYAMCALDALSVAPMFDVATQITSACHVSGDPVSITMQGERVPGAQPAQPVLGIRWQGTMGCAAQSLCLEMVFLRDAATAEDWRNGDPDNISLYTLPEAVLFGKAFFSALPGRGRPG